MHMTLPDLLCDELDVIFVGINPSIYSAERGHYFARPGNRFWPCLGRSTLSRRAREALGAAALGPEHDRALLEHGFGFTDLVKRPTAKASDLALGELAGGVAALVVKLEQFRPRIVCFHGVTAYRHVHQVLAGSDAPPRLGLQRVELAGTRVFLAPNPSGANAHYSRDDQVRAYDEIAATLVRAR
jgi:TDG/mug DNA glycosylase family protein